MPKACARCGRVCPRITDVSWFTATSTDFYEAYAKVLRPWQHRACSKGSGKTSVVEGLNNKWRNRVAGLVRKTVCVQSLDDLHRRLWLVFEAHNQLCLRQLKKLTLATH